MKVAARWLKHPEKVQVMASGGYGQSVMDLDGIAKVQGRLPFVDDLSLPGMVHGKVLWSAHADALIEKIDTTSAERVPGVFRVLTAAARGG